MNTLATVGMSSVGAMRPLPSLWTAFEALDDEAVEALMDLADARIAGRLQPMSMHMRCMSRLFQKILLAEHAQRFDKIWGRGKRRQTIGELMRSRSEMPASALPCCRSRHRVRRLMPASLQMS